MCIRDRVKFVKKVSSTKRKQNLNDTYWGKPVTGFGDISGKIMLVGLAPAAHGGTRTGRVFTGDRSSDFLYKCLHGVKISNQSYSDNLNDGLKLKNAYITTALKCVPPGDKPNRDELDNCFSFFHNEIKNLKNLLPSADVANQKTRRGSQIWSVSIAKIDFQGPKIDES